MTLDFEKIKQCFFRFIKKAWEYIKYARVELAILAVIVIFDLITKAIAAGNIKIGEEIVLIPNFLELTYSENPLAAFGSFFGMKPGTASKVLLLIFTISITIVLCVFLYRLRKNSRFIRITLAFIIAGALGNIIDRLFLGYVRDFIQIVYLGMTIFGSKTFPIFNFADASLTIGIVLMIIWIIFYYHPDEKKKKPVGYVQSQTPQQQNNQDTVGYEQAQMQQEQNNQDYENQNQNTQNQNQDLVKSDEDNL